MSLVTFYPIYGFRAYGRMLLTLLCGPLLILQTLWLVHSAAGAGHQATSAVYGLDLVTTAYLDTVPVFLTVPLPLRGAAGRGRRRSPSGGGAAAIPFDPEPYRRMTAAGLETVPSEELARYGTPGIWRAVQQARELQQQRELAGSGDDDEAAALDGASLGRYALRPRRRIRFDDPDDDRMHPSPASRSLPLRDGMATHQSFRHTSDQRSDSVPAPSPENLCFTEPSSCDEPVDAETAKLSGSEDNPEHSNVPDTVDMKANAGSSTEPDFMGESDPSSSGVGAVTDCDHQASEGHHVTVESQTKVADERTSSTDVIPTGPYLESGNSSDPIPPPSELSDEFSRNPLSRTAVEQLSCIQQRAQALDADEELDDDNPLLLEAGQRLVRQMLNLLPRRPINERRHRFGSNHFLIFRDMALLESLAKRWRHIKGAEKPFTRIERLVDLSVIDIDDIFSIDKERREPLMQEVRAWLARWPSIEAPRRERHNDLWMLEFDDQRM